MEIYRMKSSGLLSLICVTFLLASLGCSGGSSNTVTAPSNMNAMEHPPVDAGMQTQRSGGGAAAVPTVSKAAGGELID
jgi:hypothetical protein